MARSKLISTTLLIILHGIVMATAVLPRGNSGLGRGRENGKLLAAQKHDNGLQSTANSDPECSARGQSKSTHSSSTSGTRSDKILLQGATRQKTAVTGSSATLSTAVYPSRGRCR